MINLKGDFIKFFKESIRDLIPIISVITIFQLFIIKSIPENWQSLILGIIIVTFGLTVFLIGLKYGIFPIGKNITKTFINKKSFFLLILFGFLIGFSTTVAEPALYIIAEKAQEISNGKIDPYTLRIIVGLSVGFSIALGIYSMIKLIPIYYIIIIGYILVLGITYVTPNEIVGLAYDLGGITTSTITVPLVVAIGIGISAIFAKKNNLINGFGLIALASLFPMFFVQIYGIYIYNFGIEKEIINSGITQLETKGITMYLNSFTEIIKGVIPIILTIFIFKYIILKEKIPKNKLKKISIGFLMVIIGLYLFIIGLEIGIFSLGEKMAFQLIGLNNNFIIYSFAFLIGFATTMAEPTLIAISKKISKISNGKIKSINLRFVIALGVGIGIAIGTYRIISGGLLHYYIIIGYIIVVLLTIFSKKDIVNIAYDSGGVTTSTITVPLVTALGIGLATYIPGRDPMLDGFGLIAFASLFPIISVLLYGIIINKKTHKS